MKRTNLRRFLKIGVACAVVALVCGISLLSWVVWQRHHLPQVLPSDTLIVLGAQVKPDGSPSEILGIRLRVALETYQESPQMIITCGAQGADEPMAEGEMMRDWLIARGVEAAHVVAETSSFNTRQNLQNAADIMRDKGLSQATIVTSDYHVARALEICRQEGISATGIPCWTHWLYRPKNYCRESLSWIKVWLETLTGVG